MVNNNYVKGRQSEYLCITHLKKEGFIWTQRSYGSKGMFDVQGIGPNGGALIQVKRTKRQKVSLSMYKKDIEQIQDWVNSLESLPKNVRVELWVQIEGKRGWLKYRFQKDGPLEQFEGHNS